MADTFRPETVFHMNKTLSFGVAVTILLQTAAVLLWVGAASARLNALELQVQATPAISERMARLEAQMSMARGSLDRIEKRLDAAQP